MLIMNGGNVWYSSLANALERLCPPSTSCLTLASTSRSDGFSSCSARIDSARSIVRPASIIVANWREKTARSFILTRLRPKLISRQQALAGALTSRGT